MWSSLRQEPSQDLYFELSELHERLHATPFLAPHHEGCFPNTHLTGSDGPPPSGFLVSSLKCSINVGLRRPPIRPIVNALYLAAVTCMAYRSLGAICSPGAYTHTSALHA